MVTYNNDVPDGPNNPSQDQPKMKTNTNAIDTILDVDHISFNADSGGGEHKKVTFLSDPAYVVPGVVSGDSSVIYSDAGTASTRAQLFYKNSLATVQLSGIRAWAYSDNSGNILGGQSQNVVSITRTAAGRYTVVLTANALSSENFAVFVTSQITSSAQGSIAGYLHDGVSTTQFFLRFLRLDGTAFTDPTSFNFHVMQI